MRFVLFDLDGTLIDTGALYAECYRRAFAAELEELPTWEEMLRRKPASERHFLLEWFGDALGDRVHARMCEAYDELCGSMLGGFYDGIPELLDGLAERGVPMAIVTGKSRRAFEATRRCLELDRWFDVVVLEDDVPAPKPDPTGLLRALDALGAGAHESVYVGDTSMDVEAALRAGMTGASALWARTPDERARLHAKLDPAVWRLDHPLDLRSRLPR